MLKRGESGLSRNCGEKRKVERRARSLCVQPRPMDLVETMRVVWLAIGSVAEVRQGSLQV